MAKTSDTSTFLPAYAAVGEDALKRDVVAQRLRARLQKLGDVAFNTDEFDGEEVTGGDIVNACNTVPFASPYRLVHVKNAGKLRKADSEAVVAYLGNPSPSTVLLLDSDKLAKSTRLYKAVAGLGPHAVIDCSIPKAAELPRLVRSMAVNHGVTITDSAARLLVDLVGSDTVRLDAELAKMALAHRGNDPINEHEVNGMVSRTTEVKPWEFLDAMCSRNVARCMLYLQRMPSTSEFALLSMCTGRVRELICAKTLVERGERSRIPQALGKKDWQVKHYASWAAQFSSAELRRAIVDARDAERAMKSGSDRREAFLGWLLGFLARG